MSSSSCKPVHSLTADPPLAGPVQRVGASPLMWKKPGINLLLKCDTCVKDSMSSCLQPWIAEGFAITHYLTLCETCVYLNLP